MALVKIKGKIKNAHFTDEGLNLSLSEHVGNFKKGTISLKFNGVAVRGLMQFLNIVVPDFQKEKFEDFSDVKKKSFFVSEHLLGKKVKIIID